MTKKAMNVIHVQSIIVTAKTCGRREKKQKVTYVFSDEPHGLYMDKKDVLEAQINACEKLLKYTEDEYERSTVKKEISGLRMALDLLT